MSEEQTEYVVSDEAQLRSERRRGRLVAIHDRVRAAGGDPQAHMYWLPAIIDNAQTFRDRLQSQPKPVRDAYRDGLKEAIDRIFT